MGVHIFTDGIGTIPADIVSVLRGAAFQAKATVVHAKHVPLPQPNCNPGTPPGGTAVALLDESHITIHWYDLPNGAARIALDVFTCGSSDTRAAAEYLIDHLQITTMSYQVVERFPQTPSTL